MIHDGELTLLRDGDVASQTEIKHTAHGVDGIQLRDGDGGFFERVENDHLLDVPLAVIERLQGNR